MALDDASQIKEELQSIFDELDITHDQDKAVEKITTLLTQYEVTNKWMKDRLIPQTIDENTRGNPTDENTPHTYPVWFGTNREPISRVDLSVGFTGKRSEKPGEVFYGKCNVEIPKTHRLGETGRAWWRRWVSLDFSGDDHLRVSKITSSINADDFWKSINQSFSKNTSDKDALVFLHGFNSSFEDAAIRAAQIGFDLRIKGHTAFFSWPSKSKMLRYPVDEASIKVSEIAIKNFLTDFIKKSGAERVHLIAHSMGNRGLLGALERIAQDVKESNALIQFGHIILAAPDLDVEEFRQAKEAYTSLSTSTTLYTSSKDVPVYFSEKFHEYPRLGFVPPVTVEYGVDTIKVNNFNLFNLGHGYVAEAEALLGDIFDLIHHGSLPENRFKPKKQTTDDGEIYWLIDT